MNNHKINFILPDITDSTPSMFTVIS